MSQILELAITPEENKKYHQLIVEECKDLDRVVKMIGKMIANQSLEENL